MTLDLSKCDSKSPIELKFCKAIMHYEKWLLVRGCELHQQYTPPGFLPRMVLGGVAVDFAAIHERGRLVIELDGYEFHHTEDQKRRDREREQRIAAAGYTFLRFTGSDVFQDADLCVSSTLDVITQNFGLVKDSEFWLIYDRVKNEFSKESWLNTDEGKSWQKKKDEESKSLFESVESFFHEKDRKHTEAVARGKVNFRLSDKWCSMSWQLLPEPRMMNFECCCGKHFTRSNFVVSSYDGLDRIPRHKPKTIVGR